MSVVVIFGSCAENPRPERPGDIDVAFGAATTEADAIAAARQWADEQGISADVPVRPTRCNISTRATHGDAIYIPALEATDPHVIIHAPPELRIVRQPATTVLAEIRRAVRHGWELPTPFVPNANMRGFAVEIPAPGAPPDQLISYSGCDLRALRRALARCAGAEEEFLKQFTLEQAALLRRLLANNYSQEEWGVWEQGRGNGPAPGCAILHFLPEGGVCTTHGPAIL